MSLHTIILLLKRIFTSSSHFPPPLCSLSLSLPPASFRFSFIRIFFLSPLLLLRFFLHILTVYSSKKMKKEKKKPKPPPTLTPSPSSALKLFTSSSVFKSLYFNFFFFPSSLFTLFLSRSDPC